MMVRRQIVRVDTFAARMVQAQRQTSGGAPSSLSRATTTSSTASARTPPSSTFKKAPPPPPSASYAQAPPPYSPPQSEVAATKRAPPPIPRKPMAEPQKTYVIALYDFEAQADGDLSFRAGEKIEIVERTQNTEDWWTGKLNGQQGVFPGMFTCLQYCCKVADVSKATMSKMPDPLGRMVYDHGT